MDIDMPPGEFTNIFDYQAINMAAVHNCFIQGMNAMVSHKKLGAGALSQNVAEHKEFVPQLLELKDNLEAVKSGGSLYDGARLVQMIEVFSETMMAHLSDEIHTLDSARMCEAFTEQQLKDIDAAFMKFALQKIEFSTTLPLSIVCGNPDTPWFPPFPLPLKWET
ncbi:hypothetical protein B0H19DRAFT_1249273 [Mycena capillaripes]|nr:hypothetical protein B0H19DRAFT_1249273 [Mycena capillaripes]